MKSHTGGKEIQTTSHQGELVFPPLVLKGLTINKDLTNHCFVCMTEILIMAIHPVDLLYFLHSKSAIVNIAPGCFYVTETHIILLFWPFFSIITEKKKEKVFFSTQTLLSLSMPTLYYLPPHYLSHNSKSTEWSTKKKPGAILECLMSQELPNCQLPFAIRFWYDTMAGNL